MNIDFPNRPVNGNRREVLYWELHFRFCLELLKAGGGQLGWTKTSDFTSGFFHFFWEGHPVAIDYSDSPQLAIAPKEDLPVFKTHYHAERHDEVSGVYPFIPISFYDWSAYDQLAKKLQYQAKGSLIVHRQRPYGNAQDRRNTVRQMLQEHFGDRVGTQPLPQHAFWEEVTLCRTAVFVPGFSNHILDRGQWQYMGLGACTISPKLPEVLPGGKKLLPGFHYLACAADYSDLPALIKWCDAHADALPLIGQNAQKLFRQVALPDKVCAYMHQCLVHHYPTFPHS